MINNAITASVVTSAATPKRTGAMQPMVETVRQDMPAGGKSSPAEDSASSTWQQARRTAEVMARYLTELADELRFRIDDTTGSSVITVYNSKTDSIVRQVPTEEVLAVARYLQEQIDLQRAGQ